MTPEQKEARIRTLRDACRSLNDATGKGGQKALAKLLGISTRGLRMKMTDKSRIFEGDLAIAERALAEKGYVDMGRMTPMIVSPAEYEALCKQSTQTIQSTGTPAGVEQGG